MGTLRATRITLLGMLLILAEATYGVAPLRMAPWRPRQVPDSVVDNDVNSVRQSIGTFSYDESDGDTLVALSLLLPYDEATRVLMEYSRIYGEKMPVKNMHWARTIFCFGLVHTRQAREYLMTLWEECDRDLASGKVRVRFLGNENGLNNVLAPISDGLRFYIDDPNVQSWIYNKAEEIDDIKQPYPVRDLNASCRRSARSQLVLALYTRLIIDSSSEERNLSRCITEEYFYSLPKELDFKKSATAVVDIAKRSKAVSRQVFKMSQEDWARLRALPVESMLESVACRLGAPLAIAIWQEYLSEKSGPAKASEGLKRRLWMTSVWIYVSSVWTKSMDLDSAHTQFLKDACAYFSQAPSGPVSDMFIGALYIVACHFPDSNANPGIAAVRDMANVRLSKEERQALMLRVGKPERR